MFFPSHWFQLYRFYFQDLSKIIQHPTDLPIVYHSMSQQNHSAQETPHPWTTEELSFRHFFLENILVNTPRRFHCNAFKFLVRLPQFGHLWGIWSEIFGQKIDFSKLPHKTSPKVEPEPKNYQISAVTKFLNALYHHSLSDHQPRKLSNQLKFRPAWLSLLQHMGSKLRKQGQFRCFSKNDRFFCVNRW